MQRVGALAHPARLDLERADAVCAQPTPDASLVPCHVGEHLERSEPRRFDHTCAREQPDARVQGAEAGARAQGAGEIEAFDGRVDRVEPLIEGARRRRARAGAEGMSVGQPHRRAHPGALGESTAEQRGLHESVRLGDDLEFAVVEGAESIEADPRPEAQRRVGAALAQGSQERGRRQVVFEAKPPASLGAAGGIDVDHGVVQPQRGHVRAHRATAGVLRRHPGALGAQIDRCDVEVARERPRVRTDAATQIEHGRSLGQRAQEPRRGVARGRLGGGLFEPFAIGDRFGKRWPAPPRAPADVREFEQRPDPRRLSTAAPQPFDERGAWRPIPRLENEPKPFAISRRLAPHGDRKGRRRAPSRAAHLSNLAASRGTSNGFTSPKRLSR